MSTYNLGLYEPKQVIHPEDYGAKADGSTDDGPAWTAAIIAANTLATANSTNQAIVRGKPGGTYRISTSIQIKSSITLDLRGCRLNGAITGYGVINSGNNPAIPSASDKASQVAGACFTDDGSSTYDHVRITGGRITGFRYGFCSAGYAWNGTVWQDVTFENCNIGIFAYQGCQEPKLFNTVSVGGQAGTTFVAAATCFASGHANALNDNFFCDGLVYDNAGPDRDSAVINATFDTWFSAAILRPTTTSVVTGGNYVFNYTTPSVLNVSGRNIYIPSRNHRNTFGTHVRRANGVNCGRGFMVLGNPLISNIANVAGEGIFQPGPDSMVLLPITSGYTSSAVLTNVDSVLVTYTAKAVVEVQKLLGYEPDPNLVLTNVSGPLVGVVNPGLSITTANKMLTVTDSTVISNGSSLTLTLPDPIGVPVNTRFTLKNINASAATVNSAGTSKTIDGAASQSLAQYQKATYTTDGSQWYVIG